MTQKPHLIISDVTPEHYEPIRKMRLHAANQQGFLDQRPFSQADQERYMAANAGKYIVCLLEGKPVGYAGVIESDIPTCTDPDFRKRGIGAAMLREIVRRFPNARAKICETTRRAKLSSIAVAFPSK